MAAPHNLRAAAPIIGPAMVPMSSVNNPGTAFATACALMLLLVRVSSLHQLLPSLTGVNLRLLYFVTVPALAGLLFTGNISRAFQSRPIVYWTGFSLWMVAATPFSIWKGRSVELLTDYFRTNIVMMLVIAGLVITWKDCVRLMNILALSGIITVASARLFQRDFGEGRAGMAFGSLAGPDDMAAHLILLLPFMLRIVLDRNTAAIWRVLNFGCIAAVLYRIVSTGARSATLGLVAAFLFLLARGSMKLRIATLVLVPLIGAGVLAIAPESVVRRMHSFSADDPDAVQEAIASSQLRRTLLLDSLRHTLTHPIFGVGPGAFSAYEFKYVGGRWHGAYKETHNSFTQVSSECGIPALLLYLAGLISGLRATSKLDREARGRPDCKDLEISLFCVRLSLIGFLVTITFLPFAYSYHLPVMVAAMVAINRGARQELDGRGAARPAMAAVRS